MAYLYCNHSHPLTRALVVASDAVADLRREMYRSKGERKQDLAAQVASADRFCSGMAHVHVKTPECWEVR